MINNYFKIASYPAGAQGRIVQTVFPFDDSSQASTGLALRLVEAAKASHRGNGFAPSVSTWRAVKGFPTIGVSL